MHIEKVPRVDPILSHNTALSKIVFIIRSTVTGVIDTGGINIISQQIYRGHS